MAALKTETVLVQENVLLTQQQQDAANQPAAVLQVLSEAVRELRQENELLRQQQSATVRESCLGRRGPGAATGERAHETATECGEPTSRKSARPGRGCSGGSGPTSREATEPGRGGPGDGDALQQYERKSG